MKWKSNGLALLFGMLVMLVIFGDAVYIHQLGGLQEVGNIDTLFGEPFWPVMDVLIPVASIAVFLLYGKAKGGIRFDLPSVVPLLVFLMALTAMIFDDFSVALGHTIVLSDTYWAVARWLYLMISAVTFLAFGQVCASPRHATDRRLPVRVVTHLPGLKDSAPAKPSHTARNAYLSDPGPHVKTDSSRDS